MKTDRLVYNFAKNNADGTKEMKTLLGGKGANLAEMSNLGLPVPAGFTITTETCQHYHLSNRQWPEGLSEQVEAGIRHIEKEMNAELGNPKNPLLVSVRSGAAQSMPGMMDTVLNLGINDAVVDGLVLKTGNERFAFDSFRRFIDMFADVVMGVSHEEFELVIEKLKKERGAKLDTDLTAEDLKILVDRYKAVYRKQTGFMFPEDPMEQLKFAINAVFESWNSSRAIKYRQINKMVGLIGTAVNVQAMVFGNMGENCATGVCFTRDPNTGEDVLYGEYLVNAQGEDVVAGIRTPEPVNKLKERMPALYDELFATGKKLEHHYRNMQDIEFTIQNGKFYILQTRNGKRTGNAAVKIAVDMIRNGWISREEAITEMVEPRHIEQLLHPQLSGKALAKEEIIGHGLPASPGAAVGQVVFDSDHAEALVAAGQKVILVRVETSPEDVGGMAVAEAIITSRGGMTSHAAVVARGWGKPCVVGCNDIVVNHKNKSFTNGEVTLQEGDWISVDGTKGIIILGQKELVPPTFSADFEDFMKWVDRFHNVLIRTNADKPEDAKRARDFGAVGIGLCRTEHMFFGEERILAVRKMILAQTTEERKQALATLLPFQKEDFRGILKAMNGLPVTIRLLDPPLHEFLPEGNKDVHRVAQDLGISNHILAKKINQLKEFNPMLGHRGCRLGITYPEITEMQTRAMVEAAVELKKEGFDFELEIMVPLVGTVEEFRLQRQIIDQTAEDIFKEKNTRINYLVGTMIEVPRAALVADKIAAEADFFSFGTNDLTQMTFGYSRDDVGKFLPLYLQQKIIAEDPFRVLDIEGVGQLVKMATEKGRSVKSNLKVGVCGEQGGDPESIKFLSELGLNYVSCSPFRVPVARLAAAQAYLSKNRLRHAVV